MCTEPTGVTESLTRFEGIKAVLFDLYGTLFISGSGDIGIARAQSNAQALEESLESAGFSGDVSEAGARGATLLMNQIEETHRRRREEGVECPEVDTRIIWRNVLALLGRDGLLRGVIDDASIVRLAVEYECRVNPVWPMPGLEETLHGLKEKGILLGIVSNAQFYTPLLFRAFLGGTPEDLGFAPELCVWSYEAGEAKPSIRLFRRAADALHGQYGLAPGSVLYVGNDRLNDIRPASQVGFKTALFAGDKRSLRLREGDARCDAARPDAIIAGLTQLRDVLP